FEYIRGENKNAGTEFSSSEEDSARCQLFSVAHKLDYKHHLLKEQFTIKFTGNLRAFTFKI
ncbi:MAG: hypothetical protein MJZ20_13660, partial [Bacteroidaceae bacterium]|nr:hypothetical protein [Bacteroidaceae bacterium]